MEDIFSFKGITMRDSGRKYLQRNLKKLDIIKFQSTEGKLYVHSKSLATEQLVILYINTKTELDQLKKRMVIMILLLSETEKSIKKRLK